ncbi:MAG: hypothetical protein DME22_15135 [Verrucomicrobia bacterium]|nr:MAG: hypothetical protein DME22_15135 [Verrucomicrobiota bacterium]PYJ96218.1 MAG: hypothetical protein DME23_21420 [Verrucomicrobiota bacterium]
MCLLATAFGAWVLGALYTLYLDPEIAFLNYAARVKHQWAQKLDRQYAHKFAVFGGSSCGVAIDGEWMLEQYGLPTVNLGLAAGMGAGVLTRYAQQEVRLGDTLIVALEPHLLTDTTKPTAIGIQFCFATGRADLLKQAGSSSRLSDLLALRPGAFHIFTLIGKILAGRPLYRYHTSDIRPSGRWKALLVQWPLDGPPARGPRLTLDARALLASLRSWSDQNHVRIAYALPWGFVPQEKFARFRKDNLDFLLQISEFLPVLKDPTLGAISSRDLYADTNLHLTPEGARLRTDELARELREWDVWAPGELKQLANASEN